MQPGMLSLEASRLNLYDNTITNIKVAKIFLSKSIKNSPLKISNTHNYLQSCI